MDTQKKLALAARYRPQTFADVCGQDMVKRVLSRVSEEDRPACAYLFSGTRGVGKTTIARIFAKALNCVHAPCAEPCNSCEQCQRIMHGNHVDVIEIDGASNNKVDDVRALRETVGYSPMEGRYKIFIIDEAHMLTNSAFNALLKTLEEPPPHVVFMMATTEAHKFPVTIISRCQHFTFRHLNEDEISAHLKNVLAKEAIPYEEDALRLIAKRAQGSVRDSMSLLDQTLALGGESLTSELARDVLGLAGQEFFEKLFDAVHARDCGEVVELTRTLLRRGIDIGFFLREFGGHLRNLFLYSEGGEKILPVLRLSPGETQFITRFGRKFMPSHVHAAWQMVLDGQKSVVQSTEPASALELLLLNLTFLPRLLPLSSLSDAFPQMEEEKKSPAPLPDERKGGETPLKAAEDSSVPAEKTRASEEKKGEETPLKAAEDSSVPAEKTRASEERKGGETPLKAVEDSSVPAEKTRAFEEKKGEETPLKAAEPSSAPEEKTRAFEEKKGEETSLKASEDSSAPEEKTRASEEKKGGEIPLKAAEDSSAPEEKTRASEEKKREETPLKAAETSSVPAAEKMVSHAREENDADSEEIKKEGSAPKKEEPSQDSQSRGNEKTWPGKTIPLQESDDLDDDEDDLTMGGVVEIKRTFDMPSFARFYIQWANERNIQGLAEQEIRSLEASIFVSSMHLKPGALSLYNRLKERERDLREAVREFLSNPQFDIAIVKPREGHSEQELIQKASALEVLQPCFSIFDAHVEKCSDRYY